MLFGLLLLLLEKYGVSAVTNCPLGVVYDIVAVLYKQQGLEQSRLLFFLEGMIGRCGIYCPSQKSLVRIKPYDYKGELVR